MKHKTNFYRYSTKKNPNGWRCILNFTYPEGGYGQATGTGITQNDALKAAEKRKAKKLSGSQKAASTKFRDVCLDWYNNFYSANKDGKIKKPSTLYQVKGYIKNYMVPDLGDLEIGEITTNYLEDLALEWRSRNNNFRAIFTYVNKVFKYARRQKYITANPCVDVDLPQRRLKKQKNRRDYFTIEETQAILKYFADKKDFRKYLYMWLVIQTGARRGEIIALKWSSINFASNQILISSTSTTGEDGKQYISNRPKTNSSYRSIYVNRQTMDYLKAWKKEQSSLGIKSDFVIDNGQGRYIGNNVPDNWLREARTALQLPSKLILHSFRKSWATDAINNNMTTTQTQGQLGHSNVNTTLSTYTRLTDQEKQRTPDQFNKILEDGGFSAPWKL